MLQLNTEQWGSLDADVKANLVDFYYEEEEKEAMWVKEEKERERDTKKRPKEEVRAKKDKARLEIPKSRGESFLIKLTRFAC